MKLLIIAAARPNFMKVAPLLKQVDVWNSNPKANVRFDAKLVHTGQHYDFKMSEVFFKELGVREPDFNLEVGSGSHATQTAGVMTKFEPVCQQEKPDWVVVVGDVNSTAACTLVAAKLGIRVAHVEAGLRSFDRAMPEEINRLVTDVLADLLLTPSPDADENLLREGIPASKIRCVGNIMIDSLLANLPQARASRVLEDNKVEPGKYVFVTLHRPANVDDPAHLSIILEELRKVSKQYPIIFPVHPRTLGVLRKMGAHEGDARFNLIEPVGYHDSLRLTENARLVLTDSGGLQEESTYFRTPCLTLRPNTERPVTITAGSNKLTTPARLQHDLAEILSGPRHRGSIPALWDGRTAERILAALCCD